MSTHRRTAALALAAVATTMGLTGCGSATSFPARAPDAVGTLAPYASFVSADAPGTTHFSLAIQGDEYSYFTDAVLSFDQDTVVGSSAGAALGVDDLAVGVPVEVWTGACQESYPVQCGVTHVRVAAAD